MTYQQTPTNYSSWAVGWTGFAGVMMVVLGFFDIIQGIVAIAEDEFFVVTADWVFQFDVTTWGWIHLILGIVLVVSGVGLSSGNVLARTVGVILAAVVMVTNFAWLPYYPVWSIAVIAISIAVIWALTFHGRDVTYG